MEIEKNKTFCTFFWKHICVRPDDRVKPCCRYDMGADWNLFAGENISNLMQSDQWQQFRRNALSGQENPGCQRCYEQEKQGTYSLRNEANETFPIKGTPKLDDGIETISSIELFLGDTCNLKCVTCRPQLSTKWREDYVKLGWDMGESPKRIPAVRYLEKFESLEEVKFVGGEPLLEPHHLEALQILVTKNPEKMRLVYFINNTVFPKPEVLSLWQKFKDIKIFFSVDGVGKVNDYIRFPSKWDQINGTIDQFLEHSKQQSNMRFQVVSTVSLLNIWTLNEIEEWYQRKSSQFPAQRLEGLSFNPMTSPSFLSLDNMNPVAEEKFLKKRFRYTSRMKKVMFWMNRKKEARFDPSLQTYLNSLDRVRKISYKDYIPELDVFMQQESQ